MDSDDYLLLSGIQHFAFCKRQWALIYIEQLWQENYLTFSGKLMHNNADDPFFTESRGDVLISRAMPVVSHKLKVYGVADVVEFHRSDAGFEIPNRSGYWKAIPVEYKVGKKKSDDCDKVQVCCQAMCLEEMTNTEIPFGYLFYGKTRRRLEVVFDDDLRDEVKCMISEMYSILEKGITPKPELKKACQSCSLVNLCLPQLSSCKNVDSYIERYL